ncbi:hypothetical protein HSX44_00215 [Wolbachia endosymbiont of Onchocerca gibsoni]|uniref:hypothetical protein n=1 Tax=Wolbachia endosymbiont of Onchocerca gibsoni TaxID=118986 RepID=UPI0023D8AB1E|nr:hypothetical protein [Wolbachia endosymbiont of Onchocerca gibsoni]MDF0607342.1 hypothetical protein [Wolbachia endosymbiont of Onchocerca gibsoni]
MNYLRLHRLNTQAYLYTELSIVGSKTIELKAICFAFLSITIRTSVKYDKRHVVFEEGI